MHAAPPDLRIRPATPRRACAPTSCRSFEVVGTAARHCKIDGRYVDEVIIERFL